MISCRSPSSSLMRRVPGSGLTYGWNATSPSARDTASTPPTRPFSATKPPRSLMRFFSFGILGLKTSLICSATNFFFPLPDVLLLNDALPSAGKTPPAVSSPLPPSCDAPSSPLPALRSTILFLA